MDYHASYLHSVICRRVALCGFLLTLCSPAGAGTFADAWRVQDRAIGFSMGAPNLIEPVFILEHQLGLRSESRLMLAPVPLGSFGTFWFGHAETQLRYQPTGKDGVFSIGTGLGFQSVVLSLPLRLGGLSSDLSQAQVVAGLHHIYWAISLAWTWVQTSGFRVGFGVAVHVPIIGFGGAGLSSGASSDQTVSFARNSARPFSHLATLVYPTIQLIELAWRF